MKKKFYEKVIDDVRANCSPIDPYFIGNGDTKFNYKCHINAVNEAINNKDVGIYLCVIVSKNYDDASVHFINMKKDMFYDTTLGWFGKERYDYYLIRKVDPIEYERIWTLLERTKQYFVERNASWLARKLRIITSKDI